jgi:hypothetical protein
MRFQFFNGGIIAGKLGLAKAGMYFFMTLMMQQNRWATFAAFQLGQQMVKALRRV